MHVLLSASSDNFVGGGAGFVVGWGFFGVFFVVIFSLVFWGGFVCLWVLFVCGFFVCFQSSFRMVKFCL